MKPRDLQADMAMLREVLRLAQARDFERAAALARAALAEGFEHPLLLNVVATTLEQEGRFADAARILRQVVRLSPDNYAAHANLATALYESKRYPEAISEYQWILNSKPDIAVAYYFIATSHDYLGEYPEALASYEKFLSTADAKNNQLEIDKVKLRLPLLRRQVELKEGVKEKP